MTVGVTYLFFLALGAVTGNVWEETVWGGFVQGRLMARHGLLVGSLLTAVPVFLVHLPLAFETNGWHGTTWRDALITWGVLLVAAPFQRYLIGTLLVDTGGSTLAAGLMHASINAAGAMAVIPGGWQNVPGADPAHPRGRRVPQLARAVRDGRLRAGDHPGLRGRRTHRSRVSRHDRTAATGPEVGRPSGGDNDPSALWFPPAASYSLENAWLQAAVDGPHQPCHRKLNNPPTTIPQVGVHPRPRKRNRNVRIATSACRRTTPYRWRRANTPRKSPTRDPAPNHAGPWRRGPSCPSTPSARSSAVWAAVTIPMGVLGLDRHPLAQSPARRP